MISSRHTETDLSELDVSQAPHYSGIMPDQVLCAIAMWPLVHEIGDKFLEEGIISVEEPINWVSSLADPWIANRKLWSLAPRNINKAIKRDHCKTPTVE